MQYLTARELADRLPFSPRYINNQLREQYLEEGRHFVRPFGGKKVLYLWENIEQDLLTAQKIGVGIPMANGGMCHG